MIRNNTPQEYVVAGYTPGSGRAREIGCSCLSHENNNGLGFIQNELTGGSLFMVDPSCPLHGEFPTKLDKGLNSSAEDIK